MAVYIVTGGTSGIGLGIARELLRADSRMVVTSRDAGHPGASFITGAVIPVDGGYLAH